MSWTGAGTFNRLFSWVADKAAGLNISSSRIDADSNDIVSNGFGNCLTRDGQGQPTATLPMAGFRHTGVGNAQARSDYAAAGQVQDGSLQWTIGAGTGDAITATFTPAITALIDGQMCFVRTPGANATTTPTFAPNGLTARTITKVGGSALLIGEIAGNLAELILRYNLANTRWELLNPAAVIALPLGAILPYTGSIAPNANFVFPFGQALSRTTYATYFALVGTTYGVGDGGTTFNAPDLRGKSIFGLGNMGGSDRGLITVAGGNTDGTVLGGAAGAQNHTLTTPEIPAHSHGVTDPGHVHNVHPTTSVDITVPSNMGSGSAGRHVDNENTGSAVTGISINNAGGGGAHTIMPPYIILPFILRVL